MHQASSERERKTSRAKVDAEDEETSPDKDGAKGKVAPDPGPVEGDGESSQVHRSHSIKCVASHSFGDWFDWSYAPCTFKL